MNWAGSLLWGFVSTVVLTGLMAASQGLGLSRMSLPYMLGSMFTPDRDRAKLVGFGVHLLNGWWLAFIYAAAFQSWRRAAWWLGAAIGFVHALFSSRRRGAPAAFVGLVLCGALAIGAYLYVERTSTRVYHTTFGTCLGRYVTPPPANFERDFFQAPGRGEWLRTALDGSIPPARLVRMADRLYIQCEPTLGYRSSARVALAVQRLVDLELDGHFERAILEIPAGDWAFNSRLDSLHEPRTVPDARIER